MLGDIRFKASFNLKTGPKGQGGVAEARKFTEQAHLFQRLPLTVDLGSNTEPQVKILIAKRPASLIVKTLLNLAGVQYDFDPDEWSQKPPFPGNKG